ncbi:lysyl-tRNA synthetase, class 2 [Actinacidiphila yanglinensis]|uniref:Lysyl-tRNA synthetase, class 2 n=1 Tax=Actinacidiphila yanglinensis TaxID=310779 RepID=A0A1H5VQD3_9ACTN|nr:phosphatidylglycerol lysyltransferase domain-containing protein [Actinacidiphila yanglinensis]SEF89512.1 lysyl-tRNA synthetase, class 2 [Actinacidiphila yanglinensis]
MVHWLGDAQGAQTSDTGRVQLFLLLAGLVCSFLFIRFSTRMIRRQVSWWPGNVQPGGMHIHHVVFGQVMMIIGGVGAFGVRGGPLAHDILAVVFGMGCGLVLDEFALVLHLEDVYWKEEGRRSVDAVILSVAVIGLLLAGEAPLGGYVGGTSAGSYVVAALLLGFVVLCLLKGKVWTGLLGVMVPVLAVVGAVRLARPHSPWARWRYTSRPRRMARAERREEGSRRRVMAAKTAVMDAVAGAPNPVSLTKRPQVVPTVVEVPPSRLELLLDRVLRPLHGPGAVVAVWYLRLAAVVDLVTGLVAPLRDRARAAAGGEYVSAFLVSPGFTGAALAFVLSVSLRRRKRAAWLLTTVAAFAYTVAIAIAVGVVAGAHRHPVNWVSLALTSVLLAALLVSRPVFNVRGERRNVAVGLISLVAGAAVAVGAGTLLVYATDQDPPAQWGPSARYATVRTLTLSALIKHPGIRVPWWADLAINLISVALLLLVVLAFLRAPRGRARLQPADERRLRALLQDDGGRDSFGYFALRRDRAVCWSPGRQAAIVHRVVNGVTLAAGDPVGPPSAWPAAVAHWLDTARSHAWVAAVAHAGDGAAGVYTAAGLHGLESAVEPVIEVGALPAGPVELRRTMTAAGYAVVVRRQHELAEEEWVRLRQLAEAWRQHGRAGGGVQLGRLGDPADPGYVVAECRDGHGRTCALLAFVPWGEDGLTLAMLRHDRESGHGPVDLVLTEVLLRAYTGAAPLTGVVRVSLNLAPAGDEQAYEAYRPRWALRHLMYERRAELPRVIAAAAYAEGLRLAAARSARALRTAPRARLRA